METENSETILSNEMEKDTIPSTPKIRKKRRANSSPEKATPIKSNRVLIARAKRLMKEALKQKKNVVSRQKFNESIALMASLMGQTS